MLGETTDMSKVPRKIVGVVKELISAQRSHFGDMQAGLLY